MADVIEQLASRANAVEQPAVEPQAPVDTGTNISDVEPVKVVEKEPAHKSFNRLAEIFSRGSAPGDAKDFYQANALAVEREHYGRQPIKQANTLDRLADLGVATLNTLGQVTLGGLHTVASADTSKEFKEALDFSSWYSGEQKHHFEVRQEEAERYDRVLKQKVATGEVSEGEAEFIRGWRSLETMSVEDGIELAGSVAGSMFPLAVFAANPLVGTAMIAAMGASTVAEAVLSVQDELYAQDAMGNYTTPHEVIYESSATYREAFDATGSEKEARDTLYEELRYDTATDPTVIMTAAVETVGDMALLYMTGALKGMEKFLKGTSAAGKAKKGLVGSIVQGVKSEKKAEAARHAQMGTLQRWLASGVSESILEGAGGGLRTYVANKTVKENVNPEHSPYAGLQEMGKDMLGGAMSGPVLNAVQGTVATAKLPSAIGKAFRDRTKDADKVGRGKVPEFNISDTLNPAEPGNVDTSASKVIQQEAAVAETKKAGNHLASIKAWVDTETEVELSDTAKKYVPSTKGTEQVLKSLIASIADPQTPVADAAEMYADMLHLSNGMGAAVAETRKTLDRKASPTLAAAVDHIDSLAQAVNSPELDARKADLVKHANSLVVDKSEQGIKNFRVRAALDPGSLTLPDLDMFDPNDMFVTATDTTKITILKAGLEEARRLNEDAKAAGANRPIDFAHREIVTDADMSAKGSKKGLSVLAHAMSIIDLMGKGKLTEAKQQLGKLDRLAQSQRNKAAALRKGVADGAEKVQYQTFGQYHTTPWTSSLEIRKSTHFLINAVEAELGFIEWAHNSLVNQYGSALGAAIDYSGKGVQGVTTPTNTTPTTIPSKSFKKLSDLRLGNEKLFNKLVARLKKDMGLDIEVSGNSVSNTIKGLKPEHLERLTKGIDAYYKRHVAKQKAAKSEAEKAVRELVKTIPRELSLNDFADGLSKSFSKAEMNNILSGKFQNLNQSQLEKLHVELGKLLATDDQTPSAATVIKDMNDLLTQFPNGFQYVPLPAELHLHLKGDSFNPTTLQALSVEELLKLSALLQEAVMKEQAEAEKAEAKKAHLIPQIEELLQQMPSDEAVRNSQLQAIASQDSLKGAGLRNVLDGSLEELAKLDVPTLEAWLGFLAAAIRNSNSGQDTQTPATPQTPVSTTPDPALVKGRTYATDVIATLNQSPEAYNNFFNEMSNRLGARITELEKLVDGIENTLTVDELRSIYQAARRHTPAPSTPPASTASAAPVTPAASTQTTKTEEELRLEAITKAIADKADNVRMVKVGKAEKPYVLIDGVVYNEKGKVIVATNILKAFDTKDVIDPNAEIPPVDTDEETPIGNQTEEVVGQPEANNLQSSITVGKVVRFFADRTNIFKPGFISTWLSNLKKSDLQSHVTLESYFSGITGNIQRYFGGYDNQGNISGFLQIVHEKMDRYDLYGVVGDSNVAARKRLHGELEVLGVVQGLTDAQFVEWVENTFTSKAQEPNSAKRASDNKQLLNRMIGVTEANRLTKDAIAITFPELRFMDLLQYDAANHRFYLPDEIKGAVVGALVDMIGNYSQYATTYQDPEEFKNSFGLDSDSVKYTIHNQKGGYTAAVSFMANQGVVTHKNAVYALARTADTLLGVQRSSSAGTGLTLAPMQSMMSMMLNAFLADPTQVQDYIPMTSGRMVIREYTNDKGKKIVEAVPILLGNQASRRNEALFNLRKAGDAIKRAFLPKPERTRFINELPEARTKNTEGNTLTRKQQRNLEVQNAVPFKVNTTMHTLWTDALGVEGVIAAFGYTIDFDRMNKGDATSKQGKNTQLINAVTELAAIKQEITEKGLTPEEATIYYNNQVSSVSRIMMDGGYNPQSDKLVRSAISPNAATVDATGLVEYLTSGSVDTATDVQTFFTLAIAQAFGVKIHNQQEARNLADVQKMFKDEAFTNLARRWYGVASRGKFTSVATRNNLIRETQAMTLRLGLDWNEVGLQTLVEIGSMLTEGTDLKAFTTYAYVEADGLTNGPFMAGYLAGIDVTDPDWIQFMANSGFFFGEATTGNEYRSARFESTEKGVVKPDNYLNVANKGSQLMEEYTDKLLLKIGEMKNSERNKDVARKTVAAMKVVLGTAFNHIKPNPDGSITLTRNTAKNPVTVTFYGASPNAISSKFLSELQDFVYELSTWMYVTDAQSVANAYFPGDHITSQQKLDKLRELIESINLISERTVALNYHGTAAYITRDENLSNKPFIFIPEGDLSKLQGNKEHLSRAYEGSYLEHTKANLEAHLTKHLVKALHMTAGSTLAATDTIATHTNAFSIVAATTFMAKVNALLNDGTFDPKTGLSPNQVNQIKKEMNLLGVTGSVADQLFTFIKEISQDIAAHNVSSLGDIRIDEGRSGFYGMTNMGVAGVPRFIIAQGDAAVANAVLSQVQEIIGNHFLQVYDGFNFSADNYKEGNQLVNDAAREVLTPRAMVSLYSHMMRNMEKMQAELLSTTGDVHLFQPIYSVAGVTALQQKMEKHYGKEAASFFVDGILRAFSGDPTSFASMDEKQRNALDAKLREAYIELFPTVATTEKQVVEAIDAYHAVMENVPGLDKIKEKFYQKLIQNEPLLKGTTLQQLRDGKASIMGARIELNFGLLLQKKDTEGKHVNDFHTMDSVVVFGMADLQGLVNKVTLGHEVLARTQNHIDQYAGAGQVSSKTTGELISEDVNEAAEQLSEILEEVVQERTNRNTSAYEPNIQALSGEKVDAVMDLLLPGSTTSRRSISDGTRFSRLMFQVSSAFKRRDADDLRVVLSERMAQLLARRMENGLKFIYAPDSDRSNYSPSTDTITVSSLEPEVILHEAMHAITIHTLRDYYGGNRKNVPESVRVAIRNLEILLDEFYGSADTLQDRSWAAARAHVHAAGMKAVDAGMPHMAKAYEISELVSTIIGNPTLAIDMQYAPVRSMLHELKGKVINFLRMVFRVPVRVEDQSFFQALTTNAMVVGTADSYKKRTPIPSGPSLSMFEPETQTTYVAAKELADTIAVAMARAKGVQEERTSIEETVAANMGAMYAEAGFNLTENQQRAVDVLSAGIAAGTVTDPEGQKELFRMGAHILSKLQPEHFGDTSVHMSPAWSDANNKHAMITGSRVGSKRTVIPSVIALAMVSDEFKAVVNELGFPKAEQSAERESSFEKRLGQLGYNAIHALNKAVNQPNGKVPAEAMAKLINAVKKPKGVAAQLADLPQSLLREADKYVGNAMQHAGQALNKASDAVRKGGGKLETALSLALQATGALLDSETAEAVSRSVQSSLNKSNANHALKDVGRDFFGRDKENAGTYDMVKIVRSFVQRIRQMYVAGAPKNIYKHFKKTPTNELMEKLTDVLYRTDLGVLVNFLTVDSTIDLLANKGALARRIRTLESVILKRVNGQDTLNKANQLAHFMVTSETGNHLLTNATSIARGDHLGNAVKFKPTKEEVKVIDEYVSLVAFSKTDTSVFNEMAKNEREALTYMLSFIKGLRDGDLTTDGYPTGVKGHVHTQLKGDVKILTDVQAKPYLNQGYQKMSDYVSPETGLKVGSYYVSRINTQRPFSQGVIQNVVPTANGVDTNTHQHIGNEFIPVKESNITSLASLVQASTGKYGIVPVYDDAGNLVGASRVIDPEINKLREGERRAAHVMGIHRGRQVEESIAPTFNRAIVDELNETYDKSSNKDEFVNLLDPKLAKENPVWADALRVLSRDALDYAKETNGHLMVNRGMLTQVIGYRQMGFGDIWSGNTAMNPKLRKGIQKAVEAIVGERAYYYALRADELLSGLAAGAKRIIIVKSVIVPVLNALCNVLHLMARGVPLRVIISGTGRKLAEVEEYSRGSKRLIEIEADLLVVAGKPWEVRQLTAEKDAISEYHTKLSIWPLIEAGEFASIVSTQVENESEGLQKGKVAEYLESQVEKLSGGAKTVAKNLLMSEDSAVFQGLQKTVDYGDFIAKALMYDHRTKVLHESHERALGTIREEFINYDFLPGRIRGALERLGLLWFFNYKVRSVKVMLAMLKENPVSLLFASALPNNTWFGSIDTPLTANFLTQFAEGSLGYSIGPEMGLDAPRLHPLSQLMSIPF